MLWNNSFKYDFPPNTIFTIQSRNMKRSLQVLSVTPQQDLNIKSVAQYDNIQRLRVYRQAAPCGALYYAFLSWLHATLLSIKLSLPISVHYCSVFLRTFSEIWFQIL